MLIACSLKIFPSTKCSCRSPLTLYEAATINVTQGHDSSTYELCDLGEVPELLCASVSTSIKWKYYDCLSHGV